MKVYFYSIIFLMLIHSGCKAQYSHEKSFRDFIKQIELEINNTAFNNEVFSDTLVFLFKKNSTKASALNDKKNNWGFVQKIFKETDFVINLTSVSPDRNIGEYELKNHRFLYEIKATNHGKIIEVREVTLKQVLGIPPSHGKLNE